MKLPFTKLLSKNKWTILSSFLALLFLSCVDKPDKKSDQLSDPEATLYRMFFNGENPNDYLEQRKFNGRIGMTNLENIFGDLSHLPSDNSGNRSSGWITNEEMLWNLTTGPDLKSAYLISVDWDGNVSSALDVDGDRIAEIVDVSLANQQRFTWVTEALGLPILEGWFNGKNALCSLLDIPGGVQSTFECPSGGTDTQEPVPGGGINDFFSEICDKINSTPRPPKKGVYGHGFHPPGYSGDQHSRSYVNVMWDDDSGRVRSSVRTDAYRGTDGKVEIVFRRIVERDGEGSVNRVIQERVNADGEGERVITDHGADGTTKTHTETFTTNVDDYTQDIQNNNPPPPTSSTPETTNPGPVDGPFGPDNDLETWCATQMPYISGIEQAARHDPVQMSVSCDDLVKAGEESGCVIITWAKPDDFNGVIAPPIAGNNCGPFERPGPDGNCSSSSLKVRLRGLTAEILSGNFGDVVICDPKVCRLPESI